MSAITVWMIIVMTAGGQRIETPNQYNTQMECMGAAEAIQRSSPTANVQCMATTVAVSEERAQQLIAEEWWRTRPPEDDPADKKKPAAARK